MRYACRKDYHDRCNGDWCDCPCHLQADDRELHDALEGATGGGEAIERP